MARTKGAKNKKDDKKLQSPPKKRQVVVKQDNAKIQLLEALRLNLGNVTKACEIVGISRNAFYEYKRADADFASEIESVEESNLDFAESKLFELINGVSMLGNAGKDDEPLIYRTAPNVTATIFYLKTKGKKRGYVERIEQTSVDDTELADIRKGLNDLADKNGTTFQIELQAFLTDARLKPEIKTKLATEVVQ